MGTDNFHSRGKAKTLSELQRKKRKKKGDLVLIVCEGEKTEPNYLKELLKDYKIPKVKAEIEVTGECGSDPISVVEYAIKKLENKNYDYIFCIIDRDRHYNFDSAISKIDTYTWETGKKSYKFKVKQSKAIVSIPCFEFWLLLHYQNTTRQFQGNGQDISPCKECINVLKQQTGMSNYEKGACNIYHQTKDNIKIAIDRAKKIEVNKMSDFQNPITYFHELVEFLISFKGN